MLSYIETMMSEYNLRYDELWHRFPVIVGFALNEARNERLGGSGISYIDRQGLAARKAKRRELMRTHRVIEPKKDKPNPST